MLSLRSYESERHPVEFEGETYKHELSLPAMKRYSLPLLLCVLVGSNGSTVSSALGQGTAAIAGRVSPSVKLSLGQTWQQQAAGEGLFFTAESVGLDAVRVVIGGTASSHVGIALPLEIRTNIAYELKLVVLSSEGCAPEIATSVGSIRPSGGLASAAAAGSHPAESFDLLRCVSPANALRGSRISTGGNFNTVGNALLANLDLSISPNQQPGYFRVVFQISLQPSA